jgi:serine/threonine protein kinase
MRSRFDLKGEEIISIIRGVLEGLKYLGEKKLMHRDIKPANIIQRKADK